MIADNKGWFDIIIAINQANATLHLGITPDDIDYDINKGTI